MYGTKKLAKVAVRYPQSAYAGFTQSLQAEWQYLCRTVPEVGGFLQPVEDAIRDHLIPALLDVKPGEVQDDFRVLLSHGVKQGGLNIRNPAEGADRLHQASTEAAGVLVESLKTGAGLDLELHQQTVRKAGAAARKERVEKEAETVKKMCEDGTRAVKKRLARIGQCGAWLSSCPNKLNGNLLSAEEWRDNARLRYGMRPVGLCERCDGIGCNAGFTIEHGLSCKKGGLVVQRHDDVADEAGALAAMALTASRVSYEPEIFYGKDVTAGQQSETERAAAEAALVASEGGHGRARRSNVAGEEARGDIGIHGLWKRGQTCILDVRITDTDAKSYAASSSAQVLERASKEKRDKYTAACIERRRSFTPLVYSVDGLPCKEARAFERRVASLLASKWDRAYSEMVGFVCTRMSVAVVRSNTLLLRGARAHGRAARPVIEDATALVDMGNMREW